MSLFVCAVARAAALGLDYPGVHGAPELSGPAYHGIPPHPYNHEWFETVPNMATPQQNWPTFHNVRHRQANLGTSDRFLMTHGTYGPVQNEYTTKPEHGFPRGQSVSNRGSSFKGVMRVALPTRADAPSQFDLVNRDPQGHLVVYGEHDLVVESVPNRQGIFHHALPCPKTGVMVLTRELELYMASEEKGLSLVQITLRKSMEQQRLVGVLLCLVVGDTDFLASMLNSLFKVPQPPWWSERHEIRSR